MKEAMYKRYANQIWECRGNSQIKIKGEKDMKIGWYFNVGRKEFFVESNQQNKTIKFAEKILKAIKAPVTDGNISFLMHSLIKANLEIKHCPACPDLGVEEHDYYNIFGKNFSGYGSENINDGMTVILTVN